MLAGHGGLPQSSRAAHCARHGAPPGARRRQTGGTVQARLAALAGEASLAAEPRHAAWLHGAYVRHSRPCSGRPRCQAAAGGSGTRSAAKAPVDLAKEKHKIFDEVFITVKSGDGGLGEVAEPGAGKTVRNFKYKPGGNSPKQLWLPAAQPADGANGSSVVLYVDPALDSLLHLHEKKKWIAKKGANGNPAMGSSGPRSLRLRGSQRTAPLRIPVPPGTVVRRKRGGALLGELVNQGDTLVVAEGGRGGLGVTMPQREERSAARRRSALQDEDSPEVSVLEDENWRADAAGAPGIELGLHLLLRVVADVGIVGFPNAGKSSLLAALTRASPEVAAYPFTTLMPNLGVLRSGGSAADGAVLADLPGLIEGAHQGRGLGRMFLRHLRRTRALLHVVDAAAADPATDYWAVREELRMYNPEYCARPHVVALNKMDLEDAGELAEEVSAEIRAAAQRFRAAYADGGRAGAGAEAEGEDDAGGGGRGNSRSQEEGDRHLRRVGSSLGGSADEGDRAPAGPGPGSSRGGGSGGVKQPRRASSMPSNRTQWRGEAADEQALAPSLPSAVVCVSALAGTGLGELNAALAAMLAEGEEEEDTYDEGDLADEGGPGW